MSDYICILSSFGCELCVCCDRWKHMFCAAAAADDDDDMMNYKWGSWLMIERI